MMPALVPELLVSDLKASLAFWCGSIGFSVYYDRPEENFAYLSHGNAHVMLEQYEPGGDYWVTAAMEHPLGRGINFEIELASLESVLNRLESSGWPLFRKPEDKWYRKGDTLLGQRQFLVQDPDGLLRLCQPLPNRPAP